MDMALLVIVGRILVGGAFVVSGARILTALPMLTGLLSAKRVPYPAFIAAAGGTFEVLLGIMAVAGIWLQGVALLLAAFVVAATVMIHDFWNEAGAQRAADINAVISNVIIVGALIAVAGYAG